LLGNDLAKDLVLIVGGPRKNDTAEGGQAARSMTADEENPVIGLLGSLTPPVAARQESRAKRGGSQRIRVEAASLQEWLAAQRIDAMDARGEPSSEPEEAEPRTQVLSSKLNDFRRKFLR